MITHHKITDIICVVTDFCKEFGRQMGKILHLSFDSKVCSYRKAPPTANL